jgi:hypothetical protein
MAGCAMRVLALAYRKLDVFPPAWNEDEVESELVLLPPLWTALLRYIAV